MDSLAGLAAFVHAADRRSYVAAGRNLGVSSSAIAKNVARLEAKLGVRLLNRTTRSISLTEEGKLFYERCRRILDDIDDAEAMLSESRAKPSGRLRISVPHIFGRHLLLPHVPDFMTRFPDIELDIDFEDQVVDIVALGIDLAVRSGDLADTRLIARRIGDQHFVVCGSPTYFKKAGRPHKPADLSGHACIHFKYPTSGRLAPWSFAPLDMDPRLPTNLIFNNTDAGVSAAEAGLGLAHLPVYVAKPRMDAGSLEAVLAEFMVPFGTLSLVWPSNKQLSPKVRAFVDFMVDRLAASTYAFRSASECSPGP